MLKKHCFYIWIDIHNVPTKHTQFQWMASLLCFALYCIYPWLITLCLLPTWHYRAKKNDIFLINFFLYNFWWFINYIFSLKLWLYANTDRSKNLWSKCQFMIIYRQTDIKGNLISIGVKELNISYKLSFKRHGLFLNWKMVNNFKYVL